MNLGFRQIFAVCAALLLSIIMPAQELPVLPEDPAVLKGTMPNGMSYYLLANPTVKGTADFALVQKTGRLTTDEPEKVTEISREALSSLRLIAPSSPYDFLKRQKVAPGKDGFVKVNDDATVFRFSDLKISGSGVLDSTLLVIMGMAGRTWMLDDAFVKKWYSPADQAVIVSGDIDARAVETKLRNMSYMIPAGNSEERPEYVSDVSDTLILREFPGDAGLAEITAVWKSKRAPREYMNTVQPEIFEMSLNVLGSAAVKRVKKSLKALDVPEADVSYGHVCSSSYPYDDSFSITVVVDSADVHKAAGALAGVMSSISGSGLATGEYVLAESSYLLGLAHEADMAVKSNSEGIDRCMNAFLYNSSLASAKERFAFHTLRNLPDTMRQRLFNDIAKAFVDPGIFPDSVLAAACPASSIAVNVADTLDFPGVGKKVKMKSSKREHVSGGSVWTFSNGFKVIYKRMKTDRMYYNLALNGGYASMDGLDQGEGAFLADYLGTCHVNSLKGGDFRNILGREGIEMDFAVSMSNTMISGSLPESRMHLLLRSLLALANRRAPDEDSYNYYKKSQNMALGMLEGSFSTRVSEIDNIMCPDYRYSPYKQKDRLTVDFPDNAEKFYEERFSRMNDGALIIVGDMDEEKLKKLLMLYVGDFRTSDVAFRRPVVRYQPVSGWSTYTVEGNTDNVDVAISMRMPLTMENFIASDLAAMILKRNLAEELDEAGMYFDLTYNCKINPEERFNMMISVSRASEDGLPAGMKPKTPIGALAYVRSALSGLHTINLTENDLKPYKEMLKNSMAQEMKSPEYWVHAIALRYLDGKDFSTNYASKIDAVTPNKVMSILTLLNDGCKVEYVTTR